MPSGHSIMTCRICVTLDQYIFASRLQLPMLDKLQVSVHVHACVRACVCGCAVVLRATNAAQPHNHIHTCDERDGGSDKERACPPFGR